ncbi:MAG: response regulator [Cyanobacteria bacterium J06641_5]
MPAKHVLVVDDEADIRDVARLALETIGGWRVSVAASGLEALTLAAAEGPDAILLDVMMPGLDGLETFQKLQANPQTRDIPVILLTAKTQIADRRRFEAAGVRAIVTKPFRVLELATDVAALLGWASAE